jgi:hypothetical protein
MGCFPEDLFMVIPHGALVKRGSLRQSPSSAEEMPAAHNAKTQISNPEIRA